MLCQILVIFQGMFLVKLYLILEYHLEWLFTDIQLPKIDDVMDTDDSSNFQTNILCQIMVTLSYRERGIAR